MYVCMFKRKHYFNFLYYCFNRSSFFSYFFFSFIFWFVSFFFLLLNGLITEIDVFKLFWYAMIILISLYNFIFILYCSPFVMCYPFIQILHIFGRFLLINMWWFFLSLLFLIFSIFFLILLKQALYFFVSWFISVFLPSAFKLCNVIFYLFI